MGTLHRAWAEAARTLDLSFQRGGGSSISPLISGEIKGCAVSVALGTTLGQEGGEQRTVFEVSFPEPLGLGLQLTREDLVASLGKLLGAQDIQTGDEAFDRGVLVRGRAPSRVRAFLTQERRLRILRLLQSLPGCVIDDRGIRAALPGAVADPFQISSALRRMSHLAWFLTRESDDAPPPQAPPAAPAPPPPPAAKKIAQRPAEKKIAPQPRQPERAPDPPVERTPRPTPDAVPQPPGDELDAAQVCEALFGAGDGSSAISRRFEEQYLNRMVSWQGTLDRAERYTYDVLFGKEPGARAVFRLHEVDAGIYGKRQVQAVVQLPEEALAVLDGRRGESVGFSGTLVKCDPFMRTLFVARAGLR